MAALGWGFAIILCARLALVGLMGIAWQVLDHDTRGQAIRYAQTGRYAWARLIRDSASECLPLSAVGGFVLGARALVLAGVSGAYASASTIVDLTLEVVGQLAYLLLGLALLWHAKPHLALIKPLLLGTTLLAAGAGAFLVLQARGTGLADRAMSAMLRRWDGVEAGGRAVLRAINAIYARLPRVFAGIALHFVAWLCNGLEAWLLLLLMHHPVSVRTALTIDSLVYGIRSFAFVVPNALGVQEAAYVFLGGLFGIPPTTALALSLLRRARDLVLGIPALAAWQALEGRRAWRGGSDTKEGKARGVAP